MSWLHDVRDDGKRAEVILNLLKDVRRYLEPTLNGNIDDPRLALAADLDERILYIVRVLSCSTVTPRRSRFDTGTSIGR